MLVITKVKLFLSLKNEDVARPLGLRRFRQAPGQGQKFQIDVDGRSVQARVTSTVPALIPDVYAEEI
jgi:hypothetical protein